MVEVHLERDLAFPAARVWAVLEDYGKRHPDPKVRRFIARILAAPTPQEILAARKRP